MRAKPGKPAVHHYCTNCTTTFAGPPFPFDGWIDKDNDPIGTILEYPTQEDADNAIMEEYRPAKRVNVVKCAGGCTDGEKQPRELWICGECGTNYNQTDSLERAANCCD